MCRKSPPRRSRAEAVRRCRSCARPKSGRRDRRDGERRRVDRSRHAPPRRLAWRAVDRRFGRHHRRDGGDAGFATRRPQGHGFDGRVGRYARFRRHQRYHDAEFSRRFFWDQPHQRNDPLERRRRIRGHDPRALAPWRPRPQEVDRRDHVRRHHARGRKMSSASRRGRLHAGAVSRHRRWRPHHGIPDRRGIFRRRSRHHHHRVGGRSGGRIAVGGPEPAGGRRQGRPYPRSSLRARSTWSTSSGALVCRKNSRVG